jgi:hypothetical protein
MKQQRENADNQKTKKTKQNSGLKRRSQRIIAKTPNDNQQSTNSYACLKTIKQNFSFYLFYQLSTKKKQAKGKRP